MKKLLLVFATLITLTAKSQTSVYFPFPDSNATWCCRYLLSFPPDCYEGYSTYQLSGTQIINGSLYNHIINYDSSAQFTCSPWNFISYTIQFNNYFIRQDSALKTIWIYDSTSNSDFVLYNFNLNVGDTLDTTKAYFATGFGGDKIITSIDSILINGAYRKRFNYNTGCLVWPTDTSMIEGIGALHGLLYPPSCFEIYTFLDAFSINNILMYGDSNAICHDFTSGIPEINNKDELILFPNPFGDELNIRFKENEQSEFILYDIASRKLLQQTFTNSVTLNTEQLAKGIYLYEVRNKDGVVKKGKVVKE